MPRWDVEYSGSTGSCGATKDEAIDYANNDLYNLDFLCEITGIDEDEDEVEVVVCKDKYLVVFDNNEDWTFVVYDYDSDELQSGYTHKVNLELYKCEHIYEYLCEYCDVDLDEVQNVFD